MDISKAISEYWNKIPVLYKKSFLIIFIITNIVYCYSSFHFLFGNHDWHNLINPVGLLDGAIAAGRWGEGVFQQYTLGYVLPILNNLIFFFLLTLSSLLLCYYWNIEKKVSAFVFCGLLLLLNPNMLTWLYFTFTLHNRATIIVMALLALILSEYKSKKSFIFATILVVLSLSTYPVIVNIFAVSVIGKVIIDSIHWSGTKKDFLVVLFKYARTFLVLLTGCILFYLSLKIMQFFGIVDQESYYLPAVTRSDFFSQFLLVVKTSFVHLWITQPYLPYSLKIVQLLLLLVAFISICYASIKNTQSKQMSTIILKFSLSVFLCIIIIPLCKTNFFISAVGDIYEPRFAFFGYSFLYAFAGVAVYNYGKPILNKIGIVIICLVLWISVIQDFNAQKIWKMALDSEMMMYNRILIRIEENPNYVPYKPYILVQFGNIPSMRQKYYTGSYDINSKELLYFSSNAYWNNGEGIEHISPDLKITWSPDLYSYPRQAELIVPLMEKIKPALQNAKPWPAAESVQIIDNVIILSLDKNHLNQWQQAVAQLNTGIILFPPFNLDKNTQYALDITTDVYGVYKLTYLTADASPQVKSLTFQTSPQSFRVTLPKDIQGSFITLQEISNNGVVNITRLELTIL